MASTSTLVEILGLSVPVVQAPMAGVSTPELAAAVSNAGGLGSIAIGASSLDQAKSAIETTKGLTDRPFNVNVFCHEKASQNPARDAAWLSHLAPLYREAGLAPPTGLKEIYTSFLEDKAVLNLLLEERPAVVSFHFGLPDQSWLDQLKSAGILTLATATNLKEAKAIERAGLSAIIAQGIEAGGHRGMFDPKATDEQLPTSVLVSLLVNNTNLPIIAAGGIMDGAGVRAVLSLGAVAAQLGTAFILCPESAANSAYRENLKSPRAGFTRLTSSFSGRPARGMLNRFIRHCDTPESPPPAAYPLAYDAAKQLNAAASKHGNFEFAAQWAGQGAPLAREMPAGDLVRQLAAEIG